jgi:hypothetical protein
VAGVALCRNWMNAERRDDGKLEREREDSMSGMTVVVLFVVVVV